MSIKMMFSAMQVKAGSPTTKMVLLKLADNANDKGECWPSYDNIAEVCEISRRSAINHIDKLIKQGLVRKEERKGPKGNSSNVYYLTLGGEKSAPLPSENNSPDGEKSAPPPSEKSALTPSEKSAPKSVSIEPVITESVIETIEREKIVSLESLNAFVSYRKKIKKPMTTHAVELLVAKLGGLRVDGHSPQELINDAIMNGWQSVYPKTSAQPNRTFQSHQERIREENMRVMSNWANKE